ncbi:MAG: glycosyltransferase family 4 protein [Candidatus Omnitrophica bacterium]|nr:glycosyltransferase family 4 protein [Candidatus Omnitrophota bacterium]
MNILLLTPGINKKFNDNYHAYKYITESGHRILAISNMENILKGAGAELSPEAETDDGICIRRVFKTLKEQRIYYPAVRKYGIIKKIAEEFDPDIVFCENSINMPIAAKIKKDFSVPIVLRLEFLFDRDFPYDIIGHRRFLKNKITGDLFGKILGSLYWRWICFRADEIISHYPGDKKKTVNLSGRKKQVTYIPWPGKEQVFKETIARHKDRAIFIGSFDAHKNFNEFSRVLPELFTRTPVKEFYFVGSGHYSYIVKELQGSFPGKIKHISTMPRDECLKLIAGSYFCYSPAVRGGWGFIGDAWAMKTPIVVTHNHYDFKDAADSIVTSQENIVDRVNRLYDDSQYYSNVAMGGYNRFKEGHSAEKVGQKYLDVCSKLVDPKEKKK